MYSKICLFFPANLNWVNGWMGYNSSEYFFSLDKKTFGEAVAFCDQEGGSMAELSTQDEDRTVALIVAILRMNETVDYNARFLIGMCCSVSFRKQGSITCKAANWQEHHAM